jgi:hypothetical protein
LSVFGCGVVPSERDEVLKKEFAHQHRIAAFPRTDDFQSKDARLRQKTTPFLSRNQHGLAQMRQFVQHLAQPTAWNPQQPCVPPCDAAYDHRPARQQVDVSCKLAGTVCHDVPILVGGIQDLDGAGFDDK